MKYSNQLIAAVFLFIVAECGSEPKAEIETDKLVGRWEIELATRNGKPTGTLDQLFFVFSEDGNMETNLPTLEGESPYELEGNIIQQQGSTDITYTIEALNEGRLVLTTELQNFTFRFLLQRTDNVGEAD